MALTPGPDPERDERLAQAYGAGAHEAPPAHLDDAIRAAARRAVAARPRSSMRLDAWRAPAALAAVVVLSVTVAVMMREQGADRLEPLPPAVAPQEALPPPAPAAAPESPVAAPAPPVAALERSRPASQPAAKAGLSVESQQEVAAVPPAPVREPAMADAARDTASANTSARMRAAPQAEALAPMAPTRPAPPAAMSAAAPASALWQDLLGAPAEKWIQRIVDWRRGGRGADADALAAEFRRRFPERQLPDEAR